MVFLFLITSHKLLSLLYNLIQSLEILRFDVSDYNCCHFQKSVYIGKLMYSETRSGKNKNKSQRENVCIPLIICLPEFLCMLSYMLEYTSLFWCFPLIYVHKWKKVPLYWNLSKCSFTFALFFSFFFNKYFPLVISVDYFHLINYILDFSSKKLY